MNSKTTEGSGCKFEKNSVNFSCKECELMAKERDYKAEYLRDKARGVAEKKHTFSVAMPKEKGIAFDAKIALEPMGDDGKKITRNGLINKWIDMYLAGTLE